MAAIEKYLAELEALRAQCAITSLQQPVSKDSFGFGYAVGQLAGIDLARETLDKVLGQGEETDASSFAGERPIIEPKRRSNSR
jgi:hypothetical protein